MYTAPNTPPTSATKLPPATILIFIAAPVLLGAAVFVAGVLPLVLVTV